MSSITAQMPLRGLAHILYAASALGPDSWGGKPSGGRAGAGGEPEISSDLLALFTLLRDRQVPYLLVGGVAMLRYIEGRNTDHIDLLLSLDSLRQVPEVVISHQTSDFARGRFRSLRVDALLTANPLFRIVQERYATVHRFREIDVPCVTVEGLLVLKLYALPSLYRQGDGQRIALYEADIMMLDQRYRPAMEPLLQTISPYVDAGQLNELNGIVAEIGKRIARIEQAKGR